MQKTLNDGKKEMFTYDFGLSLALCYKYVITYSFLDSVKQFFAGDTSRASEGTWKTMTGSPIT